MPNRCVWSSPAACALADSNQAYFKMQNVLIDERRIWVDLWVSRRTPPYDAVGLMYISHSSQSVARLNGGWSNNPKLGPRPARGGRGRGGAGFGGHDELEATRRYREGSGNESTRYGMVFDVPDDRPNRRRGRSKEGGLRRDHSRERRRRSRSPRPREGDSERDRGHRRSRSRDWRR